MAFLKLTRDRRGYENTFLMHTPHPGARPVVLYWYRSAPGVRVGRPALDEEAIRTIEEQHPDIEFDWPHILEVGPIIEPEIEQRPVRQKRRPASKAAAPAPGRPAAPEAAPVTPDESAKPVEPADTRRSIAPGADEARAGELAEVPKERSLEEAEARAEERAEKAAAEAAAPRWKPHDLLEELVGHEIATRLHARYSEIIARIHQIPESDPRRAAWEARAEALNPDTWVTPDEILRGVSHADALFDSLRKELLAH